MRCFRRWSNRPWWRPFRDKRGVERSISKVYFDHTLITRRGSVEVAVRIRAVSIHLESTRYGWFGRTRTARNGFDSRSRHHPSFFEIEHPTCPVVHIVWHVQCTRGPSLR